MANKWTKEWERWEDGKGWTLLIKWDGRQAGDIDCSGPTKQAAKADFRNKLSKLLDLAQKMDI